MCLHQLANERTTFGLNEMLPREYFHLFQRLLENQSPVVLNTPTGRGGVSLNGGELRTGVGNTSLPLDC
jgi:hypothetical protein